MPGTPGWMEKVDRDIELLKPDSFKGYTVGDNTNKQLSKHPWHLDDEKLLYPFYEKMVKAGLTNICIHKGLYPPAVTKRFPDLVKYADVRDVAKAAKDWPQLNFIIYHSAFRFTGGAFPVGWEQFEQTGRIDWVTDLAEIPGKYGVKNVYGDLGQIFAQRVLEGLSLRVVHDVVHHVVDRFVVQRVDIDAPHVAVHPDHRRQAGREVQVRRLVLDRERQQLGDVHG
jgi:predicted TIM-barrel fold metal-dependent hydrolase